MVRRRIEQAQGLFDGDAQRVVAQAAQLLQIHAQRIVPILTDDGSRPVVPQVDLLGDCMLPLAKRLLLGEQTLTFCRRALQQLLADFLQPLAQGDEFAL